MKRNTLVIDCCSVYPGIFAWAGWANWEYRRQAAERRLASTTQGVLVPDAPGGTAEFMTQADGQGCAGFCAGGPEREKVSLASYKGKAVLINFWATWCAPCKIETPWLIEFRNKYAAQGFEVLGISADDLDKDDKQKLSEEKRRLRTSLSRCIFLIRC